MKKIIFLLLAVVWCSVSLSAQNNLGPSEKAFVLSRFCTEVKYNFVHYNKLDFDWDSLCRAKLSELVATDSDDEFLDGLHRLCARLGDGHTYIVLQNDPDDKANWIRPFPITTKRVGDRVFVTAVYASSFEKQGLIPGCEVLQINGMDVIGYGERYLRPLLASSTAQWSDYAPFSSFNLTKAKGTAVTRMLFRTPKGRTFAIESDRNTPQWDLSPVYPTIDFRVLEGNVGLLTIRSFNDGSFHREDFDRVYSDILKTDALVIDIRDNGGGNSSHADYVIRHFDDKPIRLGRWASRMYVAAHGSWGYPQEWYMQTPNAMKSVTGKPIYKKPLVLLVNASTFSSAENFCVTFRGTGRGKIVGVPTGGSTGNPIFLDLGYGIACGICTRMEWDVDDNEFVGIGITPDVLAEEDADMFLKGRDRVLETALDVLQDTPDA